MPLIEGSTQHCHETACFVVALTHFTSRIDFRPLSILVHFSLCLNCSHLSFSCSTHALFDCVIVVCFLHLHKVISVFRIANSSAVSSLGS